MHRRRERYDAVVIGAGHAGVALAAELAQAGRRTALLDDGLPIDDAGPGRMLRHNQNLIASANVARIARRAGDFGVETGSIAVDLGKAQSRSRVVSRRGKLPGGESAADNDHLRVFKGAAQFLSSHVVLTRDLDDEIEVEGTDIFINAGTRSAMPALQGLDDVRCLTPDSVMDIDEVPDHLLVLGGTYAGVELGQMFRRFGSRVSIIERQGQLLAREDRDVAAAVAEILREDGIEIFLETEATLVTLEGAAVVLSVRTSSGSHTLSGSRLLVVPGREPRTEGLDLAAAGVQSNEAGYVTVNDRLETNVAGIYALGGVTGGPAFPNLAYDDLRIIRANVVERDAARSAGRMSPYTAFTDPQLARIGLSEKQARAQGRDVRVAKLPMRRVARAMELDEMRGLVKAVVDARSGRILGAAVLGIDSGEIMAMFQIAMMANMTYSSLRSGAMAHPTLADTFDKLFAALND